MTEKEEDDNMKEDEEEEQEATQGKKDKLKEKKDKIKHEVKENATPEMTVGGGGGRNGGEQLELNIYENLLELVGSNGRWNVLLYFACSLSE